MNDAGDNKLPLPFDEDGKSFKMLSFLNTNTLKSINKNGVEFYFTLMHV